MFVPAKKREKECKNNTNMQDSMDSEEEYLGHDVTDQILDINVAGKIFQTYAKTLSRFPKSLLGDPERRNQFRNPQTGHLFFDRHRPTFESILYYYQSGGVMSKPPNIPIHIFINELIFFDVGDSLIEKLQIDNGLKEVEVTEEMPKIPAFRIMWEFLENPDSSKPAKVFTVASIVIIVLSLVLFIIETLPAFKPITIKLTNGTTILQPSPHKLWMDNVNRGIICWFTIEFILRLICCPNKFKFFITMGNVIDFLSIVPFYLKLILASSGGSLAILRVIRVLRVFKLARHSRGLQILGNTLKASFNELMMLAFFLFVMILIFGSCVYYAEDRPGTKFHSIPNAFWWAIVTMTTVGYGDIVPETLWGQLVGAMAVVCGVLTIALPVPVVVSNFEYFYTKERNRRKTEEAKKEQTKSKEEQVIRERVDKRFNLVRNYMGNMKRLTFRKGSLCSSRPPDTTSRDVSVDLSNELPNGSVPYDNMQGETTHL